LRVYVIGRDYQVTEFDAADTARRLTAWLVDRANPVPGDAIETWLWQPPDAGGLGPLTESGQDVAAPRTEIATLWRRAPQQREPDGRDAR